MRTIKREVFVNAIEAGLAKGGFDGPTEAAFRDLGATAKRTVISTFGHDDVHCPAVVVLGHVWSKSIYDAAWRFVFAFDYAAARHVDGVSGHYSDPVEVVD